MRLRRRDIRELVFKALFANEFRGGRETAKKSKRASGRAVTAAKEKESLGAEAEHEALKQLAYIALDYELADCAQEEIKDIARVIDNEYAKSLIEGVQARKLELDSVISAYSVGWELGRLGAAELCVMRICLYEMLHGEKLAPAIAINEAMDLAKKYCAPEAAAFVNGILGKKALELAGEAAK